MRCIYSTPRQVGCWRFVAPSSWEARGAVSDVTFRGMSRHYDHLNKRGIYGAASRHLIPPFRAIDLKNEKKTKRLTEVFNEKNRSKLERLNEAASVIRRIAILSVSAGARLRNPGVLRSGKSKGYARGDCWMERSAPYRGTSRIIPQHSIIV